MGAKIPDKNHRYMGGRGGWVKYSFICHFSPPQKITSEMIADLAWHSVANIG